MCRRGPLTVADDGQSGAVNDEVQAGARAGAPKREGEMLTASRERGVIGGREIDADRRQILHVNVTGYPTAAWTAQQIRNAFPWDTAPRFLLRDRDGTYGHNFRACLEAMEIDEVLTAPQSPWQNPYVERLIGSMRRECVDHVIVLNERSLHRILRSYIDYYHLWRTHLSLGKDAPVSRRVEPAAPGEVMAMPHVGGLHHSYHRHAA